MDSKHSGTKRMALRALILSTATLSAVVAILATPAPASTITFNPGNGAITGINSFGYAPGNVDAQGAITTPGAGPVAGNTFNVYYQSTLTSAFDVNSGSLAGAGAGGNFNGSGNSFTVIAGFRETITSGSIAAGFLNFSVVSPNLYTTSTATPNFFQIFAAAPGSSNSTSGTGFWQASTPILTGHILPPSGAFGTGTFSSINSTPVPLNGVTGTASPLDSTLTIQGNGSTQLLIQVDTFNLAFFPTNPGFLTFSTSNFLPETHVLATNKFSNGTGSGNVTAVPGGLNGVVGPDVVFESDSSNGFISAVPEPASIVSALTAATVLSLTFGFRRFRARKVNA